MVTATPDSHRLVDSATTRHVNRRQTAAMPVHFFLDFSNIAIGARTVAFEKGDGLYGHETVRLHAGNLKHLAQRNRRWASGYASAGLCDQQSPIKYAFEKEGIAFDISERGKHSNSEQNVDERIQLQMMRLLRKPVEKGVVILATGDGNRSTNHSGFIETLVTLQDYGFAIELMSWRHSLSDELRTWASSNGRIIELDSYYNDITFLCGDRLATPRYQLSRKLIQHGMV